LLEIEQVMELPEPSRAASALRCIYSVSGVQMNIVDRKNGLSGNAEPLASRCGRQPVIHRVQRCDSISTLAPSAGSCKLQRVGRAKRVHTQHPLSESLHSFHIGDDVASARQQLSTLLRDTGIFLV
jgi:hypothetical protein